LTELACSSGIPGIAPAKKVPIYSDMAIIAAAFLVLVPLLAMHRLTEFMIFCIFAMSFDLLYGYMGRLSFGHVLYLGTGVYLSTLFSIHVNSNPLLAMAAGIAGGGIVAGILGLIVVKLRDASFALTNLAFNQIGFFLIGSAFQEVTHGEDGISSGVEPWGFLDFSNEYVSFAFMLFCLLLVFYFLRKLTDSPFGFIIRSIKEDETRVKFLGYNIFYYKWIAFVIAGGLAAMAGTLYTLYVQFVSPTFIHPLNNVEPIFAVLIGGAGNLYGAIAGGVVFMVMRDWLSGHIPQWEWILGCLLIAIVFWLRQGLTGFARLLTALIKEKLDRGQALGVGEK
jgi:branched-chain amino acid transport system permease protein